MNKSILLISKTPGQYNISTPRMWADGRYYTVEVDEAGVIHQLKMSGERDGSLRGDGFSLTTIVLGMTYRCVASGNVLTRVGDMFAFAGERFSGLVDTAPMALYDDPEDSFAAFVGIPSSLERGLIEPASYDLPVDKARSY